jgi:hypothetical protein
MPKKEPAHRKHPSKSRPGSQKSSAENLDGVSEPPVHPAALIQGALLDSRPPNRQAIQQLQRTVGNQAVGRLLNQRADQPTLQAKASVTRSAAPVALTPAQPRIQRNKESADLLTKLAVPQTFAGPTVEIQLELVERLEKEFAKIDAEALVNYNPSCLGGIVLTPPLEGEVSARALIETSKLIDLPPEKSQDPRSRALGKSSHALAEAAGVEQLIIINTLATMERAGQLDYLQKSGLLNNKDWEILVEVHYYRDRAGNQTRLHKDTLGQTLFVNLNYVNATPIQGPEFIMNPNLGGITLGKSYLDYMRLRLPEEFIQDVEQVKAYYGEPTEIGMSEIPAHGVVAFVDETMHHKTPTMGHRTARCDSIARALAKKYPEEYPKAIKAYESHKGQSLTWWSYGSYLKDPTAATAEQWYKVLDGIQDKEKEFDRTEIAAILPQPDFLDIDELIEDGGSGDFGQANINYAKRVSVPVKKPGGKMLKRQMSEKMLTGYKPLVSTGPRKFFRTWVRAVKKN